MDHARPQPKILRSPSVKRKHKTLPVHQRVRLERVLGLTLNSNAGLSCDTNNGTIAYPAGCVVVLFNPRRNKQSHIFNSSKKTITCLAISPDGKHLVTGENGHQPAVRIWDVAEKCQLAEFTGHKFGINCVAFSPNMKEVVSVGTQHDQMISVWNWKTGLKVASNKVSSKVSAVACSADGKCFVTVGNRHVKFWYLEDRRSKINQTVPLQGRSGILGDQKDNFFCDVAPGLGKMAGRFFVITQMGLLCEFNEKRQLDKWVELRTKSALCLAVGMDYIFVGCGEGVTRVFNSDSLRYVTSLPKPHHLGVEVTTATNANAMVNPSEDAKYPDVAAIAIDDDHKKITCVYNDRSVYIWDTHDLKRVGKAWSFLYHSGCVWSLEIYPHLEEGIKPKLPPGSFLTASADDTIRVWNLNPHMPEDTTYKRNIYSNELLKIIYSDPSLNSLCNVDYNPAGGTDKTDNNYDGKNGVRSIRVSPDGADLASGDRQGNIRVYGMQYMEEKRTIEAHDSDVMCLEYTYTNAGQFLASAGRDRLIHLFDVHQNYGLIQTLNDHSSSITAVRFTDTDNKLRMISCGADKSILLRNAVTSPEFQFQLDQHLATKITLYDMVVDPAQKSLATACQDRSVRMYNIATTKEKKCFRGSQGDEGVLLRMTLDPSGTYVATSCTDKHVCILDFITGELIATMYGHSETITGVKFAGDLKHIITVSADGCIFVWQLPSEMTAQMRNRLMESGKLPKDTDFIRSDEGLLPNPVMMNDNYADLSHPVTKAASRSLSDIRQVLDDDEDDSRDDEDDEDQDLFDDTASQVSLGVRFSIGELPKWAKAKLGRIEASSSDSSQSVNQPKGRWAQRVDRNVEFKSQLEQTPSDDDSFGDRRRPLQQSDILSSPLSSGNKDSRRETRTLGRSTSDRNFGSVLSASTGDLRSQLLAPYNKKGPNFRGKPGLSIFSEKSDPADRWFKEQSPELDLDDTDVDTGSDTTEVIYPPSHGDDLFASTYRVFDTKSKRSRGSGSVSNLDEGSESTDPISLEDEDDPNDETLAVSNPGTPSDPDKEFLSRTPEERADFVRDHFEDVGFTPVPIDKFTKSMESLEKQALQTQEATPILPFSPRLSLSARFMSRSGQTGFKSTPALSGSTLRPDSWYNRNKMQMSRAMDETRKSLLAMNLGRRDSPEDSEGSPDKEDPPSPPTRLEQEESHSTNSKFSSSPPTGKEAPTPKMSAPLPVFSAAARRINTEREKRRSRSVLESTAERTGDGMASSEVKPSQRGARPNFFKATQSSKNKLSKMSDITSPNATTNPNNGKTSAPVVIKRTRKTTGQTRPRSMYASTPNLRDDEDKIEDMPPPPSVPPVSNLRKLADLSRSEPDVNDVDSSTDLSSESSEPTRPNSRSQRSGSFSQSKLSFSLPRTDPNGTLQPDSEMIKPIIKGRRSEQISRKTSQSQPDMTLDEAKNILLGGSGILANGKVNPLAVMSSTSINSPQDSTSAISTLSTLSSLSSQSTGSYLPHPTAAELAMAEEIEAQANLLRQQKQTATSPNLSTSFSPDRLNSHPPTDMEASPLDLPERDQPSPNQRRSSSKSSAAMSTQSAHSLLSDPSSAPFRGGIGPKSSISNRTFNLSMRVQPEDVLGEEEEGKSVRERIAMFKDKDAAVTGHISRRMLPMSPGVSGIPASILPENSVIDSPRSQSDTGLGTDTDTTSVTLKSESSSQANSRLSSAQGPDQPASIIQCQSTVVDIQSQLHKLRAMFAQVEDKTGDDSRQIVASLQSIVSEANSLISDIMTQSPDMKSGNNNSESLESLKDSTSVRETFHTNRNVDVSKSADLSSLSEDQSVIFSSAREMLSPLVGQLSQDLSEHIVAIIREKLDKTTSDQV